MNNIKKLLLITLVLISFTVLGNNNISTTEGVNLMRESGKIYVVYAVMLIIFTGIVIYLLRIDKKLGKLEKEMEDRKEEM